MSSNLQKEISPRHSPSSEEDSQNSPKLAENGAITHRSVFSGFGGENEALPPGSVAIPIGSGMVTLVALVDAERVRAYPWRVKKKASRPGLFYAQRSIRLTPGREGKKTNQSLHSFIIGAAPGQMVDHVNGNGLDNRRANLRLCTARENATNVTSSKRQKLGGFKGVTWNKAANKWQASICCGEIKANGKRRQVYLGVFVDPVAAARAYDAAAIANFGEFASLNFPAAYTSDLDGTRAALADMAEALGATPTPAVSR